MDGAIESGERCAHEVLVSLSKVSNIKHPGELKPEDTSDQVAPFLPETYEYYIPSNKQSLTISIFCLLIIYFFLYFIK